MVGGHNERTTAAGAGNGAAPRTVRVNPDPEVARLGAELGRELVRLMGTPAPEGACKGCAFRAGTEANAYGPTLLEAIACVHTGETFWCHMTPGATEGNPTRPCAGWVAARRMR